MMHTTVKLLAGVGLYNICCTSVGFGTKRDKGNGEVRMVTQELPGDLRVRRTRKLLKEAFLALIAQKSFQTITVQKISTTAMVNRSTFYDHFVDKYALMEYAVSESFREQLLAKLPDKEHYTVGNMRALIRTVWEFFGGLKGQCQHADEQERLLFEAQVMNVVQEVLMDWLPEESASDASDSVTRELGVAVTSWAIYGASHFWSERNPQGTGEELAERVMPILQGMPETHYLLQQK